MPEALVSKNPYLKDLDFVSMTPAELLDALLGGVEQADEERHGPYHSLKRNLTDEALAELFALTDTEQRRGFYVGAREVLKMMVKRENALKTSEQQAHKLRLDNLRLEVTNAQAKIVSLKAQIVSLQGQPVRLTPKERTDEQREMARLRGRWAEYRRATDQEIRDLKYSLLQALRDEHPQQLERAAQLKERQLARV